LALVAQTAQLSLNAYKEASWQPTWILKTESDR
jgi:hypothetical protein